MKADCIIQVRVIIELLILQLKYYKE